MSGFQTTGQFWKMPKSGRAVFGHSLYFRPPLYHKVSLGESATIFKRRMIFLQASKVSWLYVATTSKVFLIDVTYKDKEVKTELDNLGCSKGKETAEGRKFALCRGAILAWYDPEKECKNRLAKYRFKTKNKNNFLFRSRNRS